MTPLVVLYSALWAGFRFPFTPSCPLLCQLLEWWIIHLCHLSLVASSVAFLSVFLFSFSFPSRFSPKNPVATHVQTSHLFCLVLSHLVCRRVTFLFQLFLALYHSFCALSKISPTCDAKSTFQMLQFFFLLQCTCLASIRRHTAPKCFD